MDGHSGKRIGGRMISCTSHKKRTEEKMGQDSWVGWRMIRESSEKETGGGGEGKQPFQYQPWT